MASSDSSDIPTRYQKRRSLSVPLALGTAPPSMPLPPTREAAHMEQIDEMPPNSIHMVESRSDEHSPQRVLSSDTVYPAKKNDRAPLLPAAVAALRPVSSESDNGTGRSRPKRVTSGIFSRVISSFSKSQSNLAKPHIKELFGGQNTVGISSADYFKDASKTGCDIDDTIINDANLPSRARADTEIIAGTSPIRSGHARTLSASDISATLNNITSVAFENTGGASSADCFVEADEAGDTVKRAETIAKTLEDDNRPAPPPHVASIFAQSPSMSNRSESRSSISTEQPRRMPTRSTSISRKSISNDGSPIIPDPIPMVSDQSQDGKPVRRIRSLWRLFQRFTEPAPEMPSLDTRANTVGAGHGHGRSLSASSPQSPTTNFDNIRKPIKGMVVDQVISDATFSSYIGALSHLNDNPLNEVTNDGTLKASASPLMTDDAKDVDTLKARKAEDITALVSGNIFQSNVPESIPLSASPLKSSERTLSNEEDLPSEHIRPSIDSAIPSTIGSMRSQSLPFDLPTVILPDGQIHQAGKAEKKKRLIHRSKVPLVADAIEDSEFSEDDDEAMEIESRIAATFMVRERCRARAKQLFEEDERSGIARDSLCEYLGKRDDTRALVLTAYMEMFDFRKMRLDIAMRRLCSHLFLIGEAQVIDRVIHAFSKRYWACNTNSNLGSEDAVYGVAYSLLLLNTDLHNPQNTRRMSRSAFVKNTLAAINMANMGNDTDNNNSNSNNNDELNLTMARTSSDRRSVHSTVSSSGKQQKKELLVLLKEMYASIRSQPLQMPRDLVQKAESDKQSNRASTMASNGTGTKKQHRGGQSSLAVRSQSATTRQPSRLSLSAVSQSSAEASSVGGSDVESGIASGVGSSPNLRNIMAAYSAQVNLDDPSATRVKSGILERKHLFERTDKKAANRSWRECLVVVERGEMKMFKKEKDVINGDGSELTNVQLQLGQLTLRHSLTVQLPPPGYSKRRAHVFAVQLPNGGVYLYQAASADLVCEWVSVCNYWAARESKEPLGGGVGNVDYGWGVRSLTGAQPILEADCPILEWHAPQPPMVRSVLDEAAQLNALLKQIQYLEDELVTHKELHSAISRFPPKSTSHTRAFSNWERRSQYLLRELIKYQTYADCLQQAVLARHNDAPTEDGEGAEKSDAAASVANQSYLEKSSSNPHSNIDPNHLSVSSVLFKTGHRATDSGITASTMDTDHDDEDDDEGDSNNNNNNEDDDDKDYANEHCDNNNVGDHSASALK